MKGTNEGIREIMDGRTPYQVFIEGIPQSERLEGAYADRLTEEGMCQVITISDLIIYPLIANSGAKFPPIPA